MKFSIFCCSCFWLLLAAANAMITEKPNVVDYSPIYFHRNDVQTEPEPVVVEATAAASSSEPAAEEEEEEVPVIVPLRATTTSSLRSPPKLRFCLSLTPEFISTRKGHVRLECLARICRDDETNVEDDTDDEFRFQRPLFNFRTESGHHLAMANGTCDQDGTRCRHVLDLDLRPFTEEMLMANHHRRHGGDSWPPVTAVQCLVADFVVENKRASSTGHRHRYHYVSGQTRSFIRHFPGQGLHQRCNQTGDCGENMVCQPSWTPDGSGASSGGQCQCPNESVQTAGAGQIQLKAFTTVRDDRYDESLCLPVRSLNQTCHYDGQCIATDRKTYCRPVFSPKGFATATSVCDCIFGYVPSLSSGRDCVNPQQSSPQQPPSPQNRGIYIWWVVTATRNRTAIGRPRFGTGSYRFFLQRYRHQRAAMQLLLAAMMLFPVLVMAITTAYYHYYYRRRMATRRQYKPTVSGSNSSSTSGSEFVTPVSFYSNHPSLPPSKSSSSSLSLSDKTKLTKNDDLDRFYQINM